ncbi:hypothetical protein JCM21714_2047 [Gracilibacillus boraciitolerans JCM 21714]|uniref:Uncharacterized protein n=1 Tax=Gracilibacillus boraciitolerans JCM 21714 TaxID=1298598 RepID=W4VII2_9BACI|nr:hypothetical protein [Gracilibacillus boraciitolerans]GAE93017.1 hypothetical protein JCM21714_2047 [Gracilibacillus boraciitolerans JCM 21714]
MNDEYLKMVEKDSKNIPEADREHFIRFMTDEKYQQEKMLEYLANTLNQKVTRELLKKALK